MTDDRRARLRVAQLYGDLLAGFHRAQANIGAEQAAKLAAWAECPRPDDATPQRDTCHGTFDEDDFSNNTWLR